MAVVFIDVSNEARLLRKFRARLAILSSSLDRPDLADDGAVTKAAFYKFAKNRWMFWGSWDIESDYGKILDKLFISRND